MTNKSTKGISYPVVAILLVIAFAVGAGAGVGGWIYVMGGSGEASRSIDDVLAEVENNDDSTDTQILDDNTSDESSTETPVSNPMMFSIVAEQSEASFTLEEDLRGVRTTVIGITSEVGGAINVDLANPSASTLDTIVINARTIETDSSFRNRALRSNILKSAQDDFEFIIFEPTSLSNFSAESVAVGDTLTFDITGELTITGVTQSATFNASVTVDSDSQISGSAMANVLYADFELTIPDVRSVANVTDDVDLAINFVATLADA
jgi:polyisoprenoid-binding protein YceI